MKDLKLRFEHHKKGLVKTTIFLRGRDIFERRAQILFNRACPVKLRSKGYEYTLFHLGPARQTVSSKLESNIPSYFNVHHTKPLSHHEILTQRHKATKNNYLKTNILSPPKIGINTIISGLKVRL